MSRLIVSVIATILLFSVAVAGDKAEKSNHKKEIDCAFQMGYIVGYDKKEDPDLSDYIPTDPVKKTENPNSLKDAFYNGRLKGILDRTYGDPKEYTETCR
jgi:hypothetical protein